MCSSLQPTASHWPPRSTDNPLTCALPPSIGGRAGKRPDGSRKATRWPQPVAYANDPSVRHRIDARGVAQLSPAARPPASSPGASAGTFPACLRAARSQRWSSPSSCADTRVLPSALNATAAGRSGVATYVEPGHLVDVELSDAGHGLGAELHQIAARRGHDGQPGEIGQGFVAPAGLVSGPQGLDLAEHRAVGFGLGRARALSASASGHGFGLGPAARLQVPSLVRWPSSARELPREPVRRPAESRS